MRRGPVQPASGVGGAIRVQNVIPHNIHFIWVGAATLPDWARANIAQFRELNPDYDIRLHGEEVLLPQYQRLYSCDLLPAQRSDLLRLSALRRYGGWYWDVDFLPFRPLADIERAFDLDGSRMWISRQAGNMNPRWTHGNSPLAAAPDWPGWELIDRILVGRQPPV